MMFCWQALSALAGLLEEDSSAVSDTKLIDNAWRGAEAYHFYLLAQRQLHQSRMEEAFVTSQALTLYEDIMDPQLIHSLIGENLCHWWGWSIYRQECRQGFRQACRQGCRQGCRPVRTALPIGYTILVWRAGFCLLDKPHLRQRWAVWTRVHASGLKNHSFNSLLNNDNVLLIVIVMHYGLENVWNSQEQC